MNNKKQDKKERLDEIVRSRIKGLGLDALFHQVDKSKKDEPLNTASQKKSIRLEDFQFFTQLKKGISLKQLKSAHTSFWKYFQYAVTGEAPFTLIIDIGTSAIKILQLKKEKTSVTLVNGWHINIPYLLTSNQEKREEFIIAALSEHLPPSILGLSSIITVFPRSHAIVKFITLPTQDELEIKKTLALEIERQLPFSLSEAEIDCEEIARAQGKTHIILTAIKKDDITGHISLLQKAGIRPGIVSLSAIGLYDAILSILPKQKTILQAHIGAEYTDLNIIQNGILCFSRGIHWGSQDLSIELAKKLSIAEDNAETIKRDSEIILTKKRITKMQKIISDISKKWADILIQEINQTVESFQMEYELDELSRILLSGGGSQLKNLNEYLRTSLKTKITVQKIIFNFHIPAELDILDKYPQEFTIAAGASGTRNESNNIKINLLPQKNKNAAVKHLRKLQYVFGTAALAIICFLFLVLPAIFMGHRNTVIRRLDKKLLELEPAVEEVQKLRNKMQTILDYVSTKNSCMEIMREISILVPNDITITSFAFEKNESVICIGIAQSHASVVSFSQDLQESPFFESAKIVFTKKSDITEDTVVDFEIFCKLKQSEVR
ncbi:MAG: pilus assembly protein PilM [Candidatus Omnitrophota bacterium]